MQAAPIAHTQRAARAPGNGAVLSGPTRPAAPAPRRSARAPIVWGALGFLGGALFWHAVGFWSFMSEIVRDPAPGARTAIAAAEASPGPASQQAALPTIYRVDPANCTALALERSTNETVVRPCPAQGLALRLEAEGSREDLAVAAAPAVTAAGYRPN
jgi:hypothetical protein